MSSWLLLPFAKCGINALGFSTQDEEIEYMTSGSTSDGEALLSVRLEIVPFTRNDVTQQHVAWLNDPEVVQFSNQRFHRHTITSCEAYVAGFASGSNGYWSVRLRGGRRIGSLTHYFSSPHNTADMGILIGDKSVWGQGLGLEAWNTLLHWLLDERGVRKVTAGTLDCNLAMRSIALRSGMHHEATRKPQEIVDDTPHDLLYFARFSDA